MMFGPWVCPGCGSMSCQGCVKGSCPWCHGTGCYYCTGQNRPTIPGGLVGKLPVRCPLPRCKDEDTLDRMATARAWKCWRCGTMVEDPV